MISTYHYSVSSPMALDLNEDQNHQLFSPNPAQASSSSSSLSYPVLFNPDQDQPGSFYWEPKHLQTDEEAAKTVPSSRSWDYQAAEKEESNKGLKLKVWKKGDNRDQSNNQAEDDIDSVKWMSSKMRMMRKMMVSDQTAGSDISGNSTQHKFEDQKKQPSSPQGTDNSSNSSLIFHSNITVRVCSDCHTTKTPLWRSGPRGPKSLCNACGIRQRKARRAMAAAAAASETGTVLAVEASAVKGKKLHRKEKNSKTECASQLKKKRKLEVDQGKPRKKSGFEDFTMSLSKNLALQVFPQDEKEAAILLMALSYGLVH